MTHGLTVTPVANAPFGAAITGVDLGRELTGSQASAIRDAWLAHQVISFPDQPLNHQQLETVTTTFGEFGHEPYLRGLADHPHVVAVERKPDETPSPFGASWHTDWSFKAEPPAATLLHAKVIPPVGGDTLYASGYLAWDALDSGLQREVDGLVGLHSARRPYSLAGFEASGGRARTMAIVPSDDAYAVERHPLVCTHPETGRRALWVNWVYTLAIEGLGHDDSESLLRQLLEHSIREEFVYRHRWAPNMLTMWDNRCLQHQATGGYDGHHRLMHRTTLAGSRPAA